jgi:hypothetical protein
LRNQSFTDCPSLTRLTFEHPSNLRVISITFPELCSWVDISDSVESIQSSLQLKIGQYLALAFGPQSRLQQLTLTEQSKAPRPGNPRAFLRYPESRLKMFRPI